MKKILKKMFFSPYVATKITKFLAKIHQASYSYIGMFAPASEDGIHPKHRIMKYKEWFLDNIEPGCIVIDIGCNKGLMPELLAKKAKFVYGIEIDENLVREARARNNSKNTEYICADATSYDFANKTVDCVTLSNVLEHIEDRVGFLKKLIGNLKWNNKENRRLLIRVPMIDRDWLTLYKKELGIDYRLDPAHYIEYTFELLEDELKKADIEIIDCYIRFGEIYAKCRAI